MQTVLSPSKVDRGGTEGHEEARPSHYTTTLYALVAAIQDVVGPEDDAQVVATLVHLLRSGRLTWVRPARRPLGLSQRAAMWTRPRVSPRTTAETSSSTGQQEEHTPQRVPHKQP